MEDLYEGTRRPRLEAASIIRLVSREDGDQNGFAQLGDATEANGERREKKSPPSTPGSLARGFLFLDASLAYGSTKNQSTMRPKRAFIPSGEPGGSSFLRKP